MWSKTRLTALFDLDYPIVQGPFGGGNSSVALAAAVSNAGGLGCFGAVDLEPAAIISVASELAAATSRAFALNLWVPIEGAEQYEASASQLHGSRENLAKHYAQFGLEPPSEVRWLQGFERQVEALLASRAPVASFVMGVPDASILRELGRRNVRVIGTATTVEEAMALEAAGVDAVVASGSDAGGHRGSFLLPVEQSLVGTFSLVPQIASAIRLPVIAAGGVADGRGIAAALALGAEGVQIGTAFLACSESGASEAHRRRLGTPGARSTRLTRVFSGRTARGIANQLMDELEASGEPTLGYPLQNAMTSPLRRAAATAGDAESMALWAGQNAASARQGRAPDLFTALVNETDAVFSSARCAPLRR